MKILFVQDSLGTGGAERSNFELWKYLRSQNVEPLIIVLESREEGIEEEVLSLGFNVTILLNKSLPGQVLDIVRFIKREKPDIVHSVLFKACIRTRLASLFVSFKSIEHLVNCTYSSVRLEDKRVNHLGLFLYKLVDRITALSVNNFIAITNEVKKHYIEHIKINSKKIKVINRGRHMNSFIESRHSIKRNYLKDLSISESNFILVHVGRQEYQKDHNTFLKALKLLNDENLDIEITILFCGRKGNCSNDIKRLVEVTDWQFDLRFLGHRNDIEKLLLIADVFVFPSLYEGLGGALIEAQSAGLPIICTDLPVFDEVVLKNVNALVFERGDFRKLADQIIKMFDNKRRKKMSQFSLNHFNDKFRIDIIHLETLNFYRQIL